MKKIILLSLIAAGSLAAQAQAQDCSDLFISEYVVGSGNNRALELYNPTGQDIDLNGYKVGRFRDGAGTPMLLDLSGSISAYGTYVIVVDKRDPNGTGYELPVDLELQAVADTFVNPVYVQSDSPFYFNGDDAVPLIKGANALVDIFGRISEDPGTAWSDANGTWWTVDKTLVRKQSVLKGDVNGLDEFLPEVEWDSLSEDTFTQLGWHDCDCANVGVNDVKPNRINLFPSPAIEKELMVSASRNMEMIQVFNILGQEAERKEFQNQNTDKYKFDLKHLDTGLYIVRITLQGGAIVSRKVMLGR